MCIRDRFGLLGLKCKNDEETIRAYSMANYPAEGDRIMLTVRKMCIRDRFERSEFLPFSEVKEASRRKKSALKSPI